MKRFFCILAAAIAAMPLFASNFFDTSVPEKQFNIGLRFGINTTNRNVDKEVFDRWNCNSWGTGIDAGAVVDVNIRNWLTIQPGFFYESRSGKYAYVNSYTTPQGTSSELSQFGRIRSYNFTIPILASIRFNVTNNVRWNLEAGPYIQLILKNSMGDGFQYPDLTTDLQATPFNKAKASNFDFGFKFGSSLTLLRHYTVGFHYMAGWLDAWKEDALGGRNKGWVFSIGYDF